MADEIDLTALRMLKSMIGGSPEDLSELIDDFVALLPVQVQQMRNAGSKGDFAALRIAAHSCKSNARDLGALRLADLCAQLETECVAGNIVDLPAQLARIAAAGETALSLYATIDIADV